MGTVLIDRYEWTCAECGRHGQFLVAAGSGDEFAVKTAIRKIHRKHPTSVTVVKIAASEGRE